MRAAGEGPFCFILGVLHLDAVNEARYTPLLARNMCAFLFQSDACVWTCSAAKSVFQNENIQPSEMAEDFF